MILLDTNVLLSAAFKIQDHAAALNLLTTETEVVAPTLWRYEFINVTTKQARLGNVNFGLILPAYDFLSGHLLRELDGERVSDVVALSRRYTCSGQDAVFLYWAAALNTPLITRDRRLARAAPELTRLLAV